MEESLNTAREALLSIYDPGLADKVVDNVRHVLLAEVLERMTVADSVQQVCREMQDHLHVEFICEAGLEALVRIWTSHQQDQDRCLLLVSTDGLNIVLASMENHPSNPQIQCLSCIVLQMVARECTVTAYENGVRSIFESPRAANATAQALRRFLDNEQVQVTVLSWYSSLMDLSFHHQVLGQFETFLGEAGIVPDAFRLFQQYPSNWGIILNAIYLLQGVYTLTTDQGWRVRQYVQSHPEWRRFVEHAQLTIREQYPDNVGYFMDIEFGDFFMNMDQAMNGL